MGVLSVECDHCGATTDAGHECVYCNDWYCDECWEAHDRDGGTICAQHATGWSLPGTGCSYEIWRERQE